jgi:hypothetical protein
MRDKGREAEMRKQRYRRGATVEMEVDVEVAAMIKVQQDGLKGKIESSVQVLLLRARCVV